MRIISRQKIPLLALATTSLWLWLAGLTTAQYGGASYPSYGGDMEERPKVQLGIRLKIPAFKFELPRFNMPKITVSAKIRQPDRPRVINLPEINLDTTANRQVSQHQGGYRGHHQGYNQEPANEQTFSFSTQQEEPHHSNYNHHQQQQQQQVEQQAAYASDQSWTQLASSAQNSQGLKLSAPVYIRPRGGGLIEPIEAYGRVPIRAVAYHNPDDFSQQQQQPSASEVHQVMVDARRLSAVNGFRFKLPHHDNE